MNKALLIIISLSSLSLSLNHAQAAHPKSLSSSSSTTTTTNNVTSYIKECCSSATYPDLCYTTLSTYASQIRTNPKLLSTKSLSVALDAAHSTSQTMARLNRLRGLKSNEAAALSDCTMAVDHSELQLHRSLIEMSRQAAEDQQEMVVSNVETWTSAALTYLDSCMEEFGGREMKGNVKIIVRREVWKLTQLTSNALALVHHVLSKEPIKKKEHH